jgi:hypothetical protein
MSTWAYLYVTRVTVTECRGRAFRSFGFPPRRPGFELGSGKVEFSADRAALGQVFSEYCGLPRHPFHWLLHTRHAPFGAPVTADSVPLHTQKGDRNGKRR